MENRITFEDIKKANEIIKPITIKRKDKETGEVIKKKYSEVSQRIMAFRKLYPNGVIETEMTLPNDDTCIFRAIIRNENGDVIATGTACEKQSGSYINKTSYIENCETSAVGRALGMCGLGIDTGVATAEEVQNTIQKEEYDSKHPISEEQMLIIAKLDEKQKEHIRKIYKKDPITLSYHEAEKVIESLRKNGLIKTKKEEEHEKKEKEEVF